MGVGVVVAGVFSGCCLAGALEAAFFFLLDLLPIYDYFCFADSILVCGNR